MTQPPAISPPSAEALVICSVHVPLTGRPATKTEPKPVAPKEPCDFSIQLVYATPFKVSPGGVLSAACTWNGGLAPSKKVISAFVTGFPVALLLVNNGIT